MSALEFITAAGFGDARVGHAFTTRAGGVSEGPYASLNLSWSRDDDKTRVEENRRRVAAALGDVELVFLNQVHGRTVIRADAKPDGRWSAGEGDALMTDKPGLALCAQTADCTPILLFDPKRPAVAAIHSGWRGAVHNIVAATLGAMREAYGAEPADVSAVIGPAVTQSNYRVGPEVLAQFEALFGELDETLIGPRDSDGGAGLDVSEACRRQLVDAGLSAQAITRLDHCTVDDKERFFSCRRARRDGHPQAFGGQCGVIWLY